VVAAIALRALQHKARHQAGFVLCAPGICEHAWPAADRWPGAMVDKLAQNRPSPSMERSAMPDWLPGTWLLIFDWLIRLAALLWIPTRTTPGAARSWLLLIGFVPLLGLPLYLLFGYPWLSRQRLQRQAQASQLIREQQQPLQALRWQAAAGSAIAEVVPLVERQGDFMPTHGNAVELLDDYTLSLRALLEAIDNAVACSAGCCWMRSAPNAACAITVGVCCKPACSCMRCCPAVCAGGAADGWICATIARSP
jgi:hypothetical protein